RLAIERRGRVDRAEDPCARDDAAAGTADAWNLAVRIARDDARLRVFRERVTGRRRCTAGVVDGRALRVPFLHAEVHRLDEVQPALRSTHAPAHRKIVSEAA